MKQKKDSLAVIIPMYNEEKGARKCITEVVGELKEIHFPIKLIIVNDGSKDNTEKIILDEKKKFKKYLEIISYKKNKGYGGALQEGIRGALQNGFTYGLFMDSDLTNDPKYIKDFVKVISQNFDLVKASRYIKHGSMKDIPLKRRALSYTASIFARNLFRMGIKDVTNGFRMVRLELLRNVTFKENSFPIILEELYYLKKKGANAYEIPNILTARKNSASHFQYNYATMWGYLKYALKASLIYGSKNKKNNL